MKSRLKKKKVRQQLVNYYKQQGYSKKKIKNLTKGEFSEDTITFIKNSNAILAIYNNIISQIELKVNRAKEFCAEYGIEFDDDIDYIKFEKGFTRIVNEYTTGNMLNATNKMLNVLESYNDNIDSVIISSLNDCKSVKNVKVMLGHIENECSKYFNNLKQEYYGKRAQQILNKYDVKPIILKGDSN